MKTIELPYFTTSLPLHVDEKNLKGVLVNKGILKVDEKTEECIVREALAKPIGSPRLCELAKGKQKVLIVTSDHTRSVPSKLTLPILLKEIRGANPDADITILIATGLHRATTREEQIKMFGQEIVSNEKIVVHNAFDADSCQYVCDLPSGAKFSVNKLALETDLLVCEGFIEPHFFAGFSGGRKSILPGIASAETVNENHSFKAVAHDNARAGKLCGNPISEDMVRAARAVRVDFILNVTLDEKKRVTAAFAGDLEKAHEEGCQFVREMARVEPVMGDIVVTTNGGYPLDQNLYQTPKAASTANACAAKGGVIILVASCVEGLGGDNFEKLMQMGTPEEVLAYLGKIPPRESISEQWCAQVFSQILVQHEIILVTDKLSDELIRKVNMIPAKTPDEALQLAYERKGADASVVVIPDGVAVIAV
ncbi:nickel-dependent lactate racemase [Blautia producta]|uniref:nickel-dependent lactate racemase n=1 Tax=Blautia producta TaxID=33035 RepID=UPI0031B57216